MPHRRRVQKGSFGTNFEELVGNFPEVEEQSSSTLSPKRDPKLQEKIDIHALLFELAWQAESRS